MLLTLARPLYAQAVFEGNAWEDFPGGAKAVCTNDDIDDDNDGLIELCYLEDVDAMRHVLDGSGYQSSTATNKVTSGCPLVEGSETCKGYELVRNLDFNDDDSYISTANKVAWTTASGWRTIEGLFTAALEGNGHTLSNFYISRTAEQRDETGFLQNNQGYIRNFGLADVNVSITRSSLNRARSGILVVVNAGSIMNCYITGNADYKYIVIDNIPASVHSAGVASLNQGKISNVYMDMAVKWALREGLFVNVNTGEIANSYARGTINKVGFSFELGFVYKNNGSAAIINNVYYAVAVSGSGPIATYNDDAALISNSYWDNVKWQSNLSDAALQSRGRARVQGSRGFTTSKLQKPLAPGKSKGKPYFEWREENWDFGTRREYPALKHALGDDADNPACGTSQQPECDALLQGQGRNNQPRIIAPQNNDEILITKRDADTSKKISVTVSDLDVADELTLLLSDEGQKLVMLETTKAQVLPNGKSKRGINEELSIRVPQEIISGMTILRLLAKDNNALGSAESDSISLKVTAIDNTQPTVAPIADIVLLDGANTTLNMVVADADDDLLNVRLDSSDSMVATATITVTSGANRTLEIAALDEGMTTITVTVNDGRKEINSTATETFMVEVAANEAPTLSITPTSRRLQVNDTAEITATVSDLNFDLNDVITLTAMSSMLTVVSVAPQNIDGIVDVRSAILTLTAHAGGDATITVTATDNKGASVSKTVSVHVNAPPTITITPDPSDLMLLEGTSKTLVVTAADDNTDDVAKLMVDVMSDNPTTATATLGAVDGSDYHLVIRAIKAGTVPITVSVDDGSSRATKTFEVTVVENQAPMLEVVSKPSQPIESGTTASVVISVRDANFDVNDSVSLEAKSSTASVVSVTPESISDIGSNTTKTFILIGKRVGESEISFSVTDRNGSSDTVSVLLSVYSSLATGTVPEEVIATVGEVFSTETRTFFTYRGSDELSYTVSYATTTPTWLSFNAVTGEISGTPQAADASTDMDGVSVTVTATDDSGGIAEAMFTLLINAEPSGTVTIGFDATTWQLTATSGVADANGIDETMTSYQWFKGETVVSTTDSNTYTIPNTNSGRDGGTKYRVDVTYVDNIEQSVTTSSDIYTVVNKTPMIVSVIPTKPGYDEGERVSVITNANDANHDDLTYTLSVNQGAEIINEFNRVPGGATLSFDVPANWIKDTSADNTTRTLSLKIVVSDGSLSATQTVEVVVTKINNGVPTIRPLITRDDKRLTLRAATDNQAIAADPDGAHDNPDKFYRWQWCQSPCSLWTDISDATTATYIIPDDISDTDVQDNDKFRIKIGYTDGQGYSETIFSGHRAASADADFKVRAKVFLEGPLQ